jgi:hypothetical protein
VLVEDAVTSVFWATSAALVRALAEFAVVGWLEVTVAVAEEIPKALVTLSPTKAPTLGTAIERAVANEPTAIAADPNLEKNPDLRLLNVYGLLDSFELLDSFSGLGISNSLC